MGTDIEMTVPQDYDDRTLDTYNIRTCRAVSTPGTKTTNKDIDTDRLLTEEEKATLRRATGQLIWLTAVRPDIQYETKEISRKLTQAQVKDEQRAKHILRYLQGTRDKALKLEPKTKDNELTIDIYVDSDWGGQQGTRKSTSGSVLQILNTSVQTSSKTQQVIALSSGEAELYAISSGCQQALGLRNLLLELDIKQTVPIRIYTDSTAGNSIAV